MNTTFSSTLSTYRVLGKMDSREGGNPLFSECHNLTK